MVAQLFVSGLVLGCMYGLIGLGYSLIFKASGVMNLSQGDMLTLGAFLGYTFYGIMKLPFVISLILTVAIMFAFGFFLQKGIISSILARGVGVTSVMLATFAISYIIQNGARLIWGAVTLQFPSILPVSTVTLFGKSYQAEALLCVVVSVVAMLCIHLFLSKTKFGTAMRAASSDALAARSLGIDVALASGVTWGLSCGVAALGGMLVGPLYGVYTTLGGTISSKAFSGSVMGGMGNMYGAILGGVILGLIETFVSGYISSDLKDLVAYAILLIFLFIKPRGLLNSDAVDA